MVVGMAWHGLYGLHGWQAVAGSLLQVVRQRSLSLFRGILALLCSALSSYASGHSDISVASHFPSPENISTYPTSF
ncbi:hypothetical protein VTL71DRAFT_4146 [Oculimacula yallundae]|uniref:Uncharacterized protein n=1 Tax=Oculimacula yallundae TaxID=86028 RepID=A0ABR4C505_9HELO